jgi:MFS family permease
VGFLTHAPWSVLLVFAALHTMFTLIDGSVITAGMVTAAEPARRGSTMAVYSFMGFGAGCIAPAAFGVVLDLTGGRHSTFAWGMAFASLGAIGLLALIPARRLAARERAPNPGDTVRPTGA